MPRLALNPLGAPTRAQRILVIRLAAMGDVIRTLPAVALLRDHHPDSRIDWLVEERAASVVELRGFVDSVVVFPRARIESLVRSGRWVQAARVFACFARELRARGVTALQRTASKQEQCASGRHFAAQQTCGAFEMFVAHRIDRGNDFAFEIFEASTE